MLKSHLLGNRALSAVRMPGPVSSEHELRCHQSVAVYEVFLGYIGAPHHKEISP